jgi:hypothetical protein
MRIDLHTHSSVSDGTDAPAELVRQAARADLSVVAVTDHDTFDGWAGAFEAADAAGVTVVGGVEMSTTLDGAGVHLLAYLPDPAYAPLVGELARIRADRARRLPVIAERLTSLGLPLTVDDILAAAGDATTLGRPHVADAMIAKGYVRDRREAFSTWLAAGGPAFVRKYAPPTADAIALVRAAGGVPVLAHPWGRGSRDALNEETIGDLADTGLAGLEVDHASHDDDTRRRLRAIAAEHNLIVTGSSDHHGKGKAGHDLGTETTAPGQYERLVAEAEATARAARRRAPRPTSSPAGPVSGELSQ